MLQFYTQEGVTYFQHLLINPKSMNGFRLAKGAYFWLTCAQRDARPFAQETISALYCNIILFFNLAQMRKYKSTVTKRFLTRTASILASGAPLVPLKGKY